MSIYTFYYVFKPPILADSDPKAWGHVIDINYKGVYYCIREVLKPMVKQEEGTIINISSGAAYGALEGWSHYCSSKAAALSLTRCGHHEYADQGIRVIGLSPGTVDTEMQVAIQESEMNPVSKLDPGVHISPAWVAKAVAYLCTEQADGYRGEDCKLRSDEVRIALGLPAVSS